MSFHSMWAELLPVGRSSASGGYRRYAWTGADGDCRAWFRQQAEDRGLAYETDRNGNQWAWLGDPAAGDAVVTGSHLDSVPDGGAFDGPLGVVSSFAALDELRHRGARFTRPLAVVNFGDEEGARFGLACVGSRLSAGQLTVEQA
ncbi:M20/M25/M40 family metallo-hydrolase, partial [Streptomyces sp. SID625]|nr:M20/M25/M40 family metallo-hydrolase [Streptomyces sp. SID625]